MGRATPVGNAKTCRLPGLYTGTRGTSTGRAARSRVGTGLPRASRPGNGQASVPGWSSFAGGVPSQYLGLAASRWSLAFFPRELAAVTLPCSHSLPLSSYHHAPSPHRPAHSRVPGCTKMHLSCQGSPSEDPFLRCPVLCCLVLRCSFRVAVVAQKYVCNKAVLEGGKAIVRQIGCRPRHTRRRCCRWSVEWHKPETCGMNRRRFPSESASKHQSREQHPEPERAEPEPQTVGACAATMQLAGIVGAGWAGLSGPISIRHPTTSSQESRLTGFGQQVNTTVHTTPHQRRRITPVAAAPRLPNFTR